MTNVYVLQILFAVLGLAIGRVLMFDLPDYLDRRRVRRQWEAAVRSFRKDVPE